MGLKSGQLLGIFTGPLPCGYYAHFYLLSSLSVLRNDESTLKLWDCFDFSFRKEKEINHTHLIIKFLLLETWMKPELMVLSARNIRNCVSEDPWNGPGV